MTTKIAKVVSVGSLNGFGKKAPILFLEISFDGVRLSITGVEGPKRNGGCVGGCGQVVGSLDHVLAYEPGFNAENVAHLKAVWERWHLNDMRAGCEHQRDWDTARTVEIVRYKMTSEACSDSAEAKRLISTLGRNLAHIVTTGSNEEIRPLCDDIMRAVKLADLPYWTDTAPDADSIASGRYEVESRKTVSVGNLGFNEHPEGLLSKPCEVCGYKYGTEWKCETVPQEVLAFLESLPATSLPYPWHKSWER